VEFGQLTGVKMKFWGALDLSAISFKNEGPNCKIRDLRGCRLIYNKHMGLNEKWYDTGPRWTRRQRITGALLTSTRGRQSSLVVAREDEANPLAGSPEHELLRGGTTVT
jgi:hypothetical protein